MKIIVNDTLLFELSEIQKKIICNDIPDEIFEEDMKRRLEWILMHKVDRCAKRLRQEWEPKLKAEGVQSFPSDDEEFAALVFQHPEYKNRTQREVANTI